MATFGKLLTNKFSWEMVTLAEPATFLFGMVERLTLQFRGEVKFEIVVGGIYPQYPNGDSVINSFNGFSKNGSTPPSLDVYQQLVVDLRRVGHTESEIADILTNLMKFVNFMDKLK